MRHDMMMMRYDADTAIENTRYCTVFDNVTSLGLAACAPVECTAEYLENLPRSLVCIERLDPSIHPSIHPSIDAIHRYDCDHSHAYALM